jgi:hypothetical protein
MIDKLQLDIATGGLKNAVCKFTAISTLNQISISIFSCRLRLMGNDLDAKFAWFEGQTASMRYDMGSITDCHSREGGNP